MGFTGDWCLGPRPSDDPDGHDAEAARKSSPVFEGRSDLSICTNDGSEPEGRR